MKTSRALVTVDPLGVFWAVRQLNHRTILCVRRDDAIDTGAWICRFIEASGGAAQLKVRNRLGRFSFERTYPDDTPDRKG